MSLAVSSIFASLPAARPAASEEAVELGHAAAPSPRWLFGLFARTVPEAYWASLCPDLMGEAATGIGRRR